MYQLAVYLFFFFFLLIPTQVFAKEPSLERYYDWSSWNTNGQVLAESTSSVRASLKSPVGLQPDSPFYFFKPIVENISLALTFDPKSKEVKRLDITEERLAETQKLLEKKKYDLAGKNLDRYQSSLNQSTNSLDNLKKGNIEVKDLAQKIELYSAKHSLVLEKLQEEVPDKLKNEIEKALASSQKGMDKSADELGEPAVTAELKNRLDSLRVLGVLNSDQINSILTLGSREDVRKKVEDLAAQDLIPRADVKKMDQAQLSYFPSDYSVVTEKKKLVEFAKLENEKPDEQIQKKIEKFISERKQNEPVPQELQKWWAMRMRYKELQATLRPELVPPPAKIVEPEKKQEVKKIDKPKSKTIASSSSEQSSSVPSSSPTISPPVSDSSSVSQPTTPSTQLGSQCSFGAHALGTIFGDGRCYYLRCDEGWYNNDLDVNNGCESQTNANVTPDPGSVSAGICGSGQVKNGKGECVPENQTCTDTNTAVPFYTSGTCTDTTGTYTNSCAGSVVNDYFCEGTWDPATYSSKNHKCVTKTFDCAIADTQNPYVCSVGSCSRVASSSAR